MNAFRFPLQKVLEWRRTQLDLEESRLQQRIAAAAELDRARAELTAQGIRAEADLRSWRMVDGRDLGALDEFHLRVQSRGREIDGRRARCREELQAQQVRLLEARRRSRLLERLRDRRWAEWQAAQSREIEETSAESYLARWNRRPPSHSPL